MEMMRFASVFIAASLVCAANLLFPISAWGEAATSCGVRLETDGEWPTASPEEAGLDPTILCSLNEVLDKSPEMNVHAVLVVRGGKLVYETYRAGEDWKWDTYLGVTSHTPGTEHDVASISKSVFSLLFGIALDRKLIASIDEPVFTYFPEYAALRTPAKDRILLRHLLAMRSGLAWNELSVPYSDPTNSYIMLIQSVEPYRFVLQQQVWREPDEEWNYSGGDTELLAGVLKKVTGVPLDDFARETLFEALGITQFSWVYMPNGEISAAGGLRLRPRDMAKIGELVLRKGSWNGRRVVSEAWIEESTRGRPGAGRRWLYGYQWWADGSTFGGRKFSWIAGRGFGGQRLYVAPADDLVVVITAGLYNASLEDQERIVASIFYRYVLAAIRR